MSVMQKGRKIYVLTVWVVFPITECLFYLFTKSGLETVSKFAEAVKRTCNLMTSLLQCDDVWCISKKMMDVHLNPVLWASQHARAKRFLIVILSPASNWASNTGHGKLRLPHICFFIGPEMSMRFDLQPALCESYLFTWQWKMASLKLSTS